MATAVIQSVCPRCGGACKVEEDHPCEACGTQFYLRTGSLSGTPLPRVLWPPKNDPSPFEIHPRIAWYRHHAIWAAEGLRRAGYREPRPRERRRRVIQIDDAE